MTHKRNVDRFGATRLARESEKGDIAAVRAAYEAAPEEIDQPDFAGIAPLQKAALHGYVDVVDFLISKGCRTDCESNDRDTPLIDAVENGHLEVVRLLLDKGGVNPHHQNKKGQRAIDVVDPDYSDHEEIEQALKEAMIKRSDVAKDDDSHPGFTQQRSASRLLYNEYNMETLIEKAGDGDIAAVGELINSNIKPNIACGVAASRGGHYDILSILLASGLKADPDPSKHSETPMLVAIGRGHLKIVNLLLEQDNFNPTRRNREGKTYWEISEERKGPKWQQERDILKSAYEYYQEHHRSPKRTKKEVPNPATVRGRKKSPVIKRERSSSPRPDSRRANPSKTETSTQPQKGRRLMSGKEMANRDAKRRRRVVQEDSTDEDSDEEVRPPARKVMTAPRSYSEGEDNKEGKKPTKHRSEGNGVGNRTSHAPSHDSDHGPQPKQPKIRTRTEKVLPKPKTASTPDAESPDERKPVNKLAKPRVVDGKIKKRRASDVAAEERVAKRTPTTSSRSTPAPPEKASTPEVVRERRQEADKQAADAKRKAAEAESRRLEEEEEAARKAAEEEDLKKKAAEAEARRLADEAEAERVKKEEEARIKAHEEDVARQLRLAKLPASLRRACLLGRELPLHFSGEELGVSALFLPLYYASSKELFPQQYDGTDKSYILSFQAVGLLGLPELDLARLGPPYSSWDRHDVSKKQREVFLRHFDIALLAQPFRFPMQGMPGFDWEMITESVKEARQQFLEMEGLYWIEDTVLCNEAEANEFLKPLLADIKDLQKRIRIPLPESDIETVPGKKRRARKSFMEAVLAAQAKPNGTVEVATVNGDG
jgi:ankyrin repeat protein